MVLFFPFLSILPWLNAVTNLARSFSVVSSLALIVLHKDRD